MGTRYALGVALALTLPAAAGATDPGSGILIDDVGVFPENIAAGRDGTLWFGSVSKGTVYRALPGVRVATAWIAPGTADMRQAMGLWADERRKLLWVCAPGARAKDGKPAEPTAIKTFDLKTGAFRKSYGFEGGGRCNDLTLAKNGTVYAGDFETGRVMRIAKGETIFRSWAVDPRLASVDGMAILADGHLYANTYRSNLLFRIPVLQDGRAGTAVEIGTDRPLVKPDGMRAVAADKLLLAEGEGRLVELTVAGDKARVRVLAEGLADSPAGVAIVKGTAFVVQAKWAAMSKPIEEQGSFGAVAVAYPPAK